MGLTKAEREQRKKERLAELKAFDAGAAEEASREMGRQVLYVAGIDEVGRGPLAGPVVAGCVVLPKDFSVLGVDDSKKLTEKSRERLAPQIKEQALAWGLGRASERIIDTINILEATKAAMIMAVTECDSMLREKTGHGIDLVLIDAVKLDDLEIPQKSIIKGDSTSLAVASASILAKVSRDALMVECSKQYPGYAFEKNKGYGTKQHYIALKQLGPCAIHRRSFLGKLKK